MNIMHFAQEIILPRDPIDFAWKLRAWGMDTSHEGFVLALDQSVMDYMKDWSFNFYYDNFRLIVGLYNLALVGSKVQVGSSKPIVVVDELLLQTSQSHKPIHVRKDSVIVSPLKLHYAVMDS